LDKILRDYNALLASKSIDLAFRLTLTPLRRQKFYVYLPASETKEFQMIAQTQVNYEYPVSSLMSDAFPARYLTDTSSSIIAVVNNLRSDLPTCLSDTNTVINGMMTLFGLQFYTRKIRDFKTEKDKYDQLVRTPLDVPVRSLKAVSALQLKLTTVTANGKALGCVRTALAKTQSVYFSESANVDALAAAFNALFTADTPKDTLGVGTDSGGIFKPGDLGCPGVVIEARKTNSPFNSALSPVTSDEDFAAALGVLRGLQACPSSSFMEVSSRNRKIRKAPSVRQGHVLGSK